MLQLDIRTLFLTAVFVSVLLGLVSLAFSPRVGGTRAMRGWGGSVLVLAAGLAFVVLRGRIPDFVSIHVANTLIAVSAVLAYRSMRVFHGLATRDHAGWALVLAVFGVSLYFDLVEPSLRMRSASVSAALAIVMFRSALLVGGNPAPEMQPSQRYTAGVFWLYGALHLVRCALVLAGGPVSDIMTPNLSDAIMLLTLIMCGIGVTLGVLWMEIQAVNQVLAQLATQDSLTATLNRRAFLAEFEREASRSARHKGAFSLAIFDLDRFKSINDRYGHPAGDEVLRSVADTIRASIRRHEVLGRYGGEEFALLMPTTGKEMAALVAERIRCGVEEKGVQIRGERIHVTLSGGLATSGIDGEDWDTLLSAADNALYVAKKTGRNRIVNAGVPLARKTGTA